ncbi:MAG: hypothetical protein AAGH81_04305 [Bacteroidota bacterium]
MKGEKATFKLRFNKADDYSLTVLNREDHLFRLSFYAPNDELSWLYKHSLLRELGFKTNEEKDDLSREFRLQSPKNVLPLKELISKIVIGLKYPLGIKSEIYLEI